MWLRPARRAQDGHAWGRRPRPARPAPVAGAPRAGRGRSLGTTGALASVLLALGAFTIGGSAVTSEDARRHSQALDVDAWFSEAGNAIAQEEVHVRHYQVEPSVAVFDRYQATAGRVLPALRNAMARDPEGAGTDAQRLSGEQEAYRKLSDRLLALVADSDPTAIEVDRIGVTPAYYTLQEDIDEVSRAYHARAQSQSVAMRRGATRMLIGTSAGFVIGLGLVAVIWQMVLGYQRRLVQDAHASQHLAVHDPLTGLPNRVLFRRRLGDSLTTGTGGEPGGPASTDRSGRQDRQLAVMIIDLNGFKAVNDTLGHQAGDQLLIEVGQRLSASAREVDLVARLGGDEFAVLVPELSGPAEALSMAERFAAALRHDFALEDGLASVSGSIGVMVGPATGDAEEFVRHADAAMYRAKSDGGGVALYTPGTDSSTPDRMALFGELRALLDAGDPEGQLELHFQPQVRLVDSAVTDVEALVRWRHPARGLLLPAAFLPIAESRGLEIPLTYHLLDIAVGHAARWQAAGHPLAVAVNMSPRCLVDDEFVPRVQAALARSGLPRHLLKLELTEGSVMTEPERSRETLRQIRDEGVKVSIDDFGTGFSSLLQLRQLPADELKIDQSFVCGLRRDSEDYVLVRSMIDLAHNLGLAVVAEGIESLDTLALLGELGCDLGQGYALSKPMPDDALLNACEQVRQRSRSVSWSTLPAQRQPR